MKIIKKAEQEKILLMVEGRIDTTTALEFQEYLLCAIEQSKEVIVNLEKVDFVSSAGLRSFLQGQKAAKKRNTNIILEHVPELIMDVFQMTGFTNILTIR